MQPYYVEEREMEGKELFRVSYCNIKGTDLYELKLIGFNQTIVVGRGFLIKNIGMHPRAVVGCMDVSYWSVKDLGFVVEWKDANLIG